MEVPIIGAGIYGVDFEIAARSAVSATGNALMEWKRSDDESFNTSNIENIILFVKSEDDHSVAAGESETYKDDQMIFCYCGSFQACPCKEQNGLIIFLCKKSMFDGIFNGKCYWNRACEFSKRCNPLVKIKL